MTHKIISSEGTYRIYFGFVVVSGAILAPLFFLTASRVLYLKGQEIQPVGLEIYSISWIIFLAAVIFGRRLWKLPNVPKKTRVFYGITVMLGAHLLLISFPFLVEDLRLHLRIWLAMALIASFIFIYGAKLALIHNDKLWVKLVVTLLTTIGALVFVFWGVILLHGFLNSR